jgi:hypothetical protein
MSLRRYISMDVSRAEWEPVAKAVNAGRYDRASDSMVCSLLIGMRSWKDGHFHRAKKLLRAMRQSNE